MKAYQMLRKAVQTFSVAQHPLKKNHDGRVNIFDCLSLFAKIWAYQ